MPRTTLVDAADPNASCQEQKVQAEMTPGVGTYDCGPESADAAESEANKVRGGTRRNSRNFLANDVLEVGDGRGQVCKISHKKGALSGVFLPTCENMWGVLIFLRFHFIVGEAGLWQALCVIGLSFLAALCTTTSVSAMASSGGIVSGGSPYKMISRALGPAAGATVGIMYWLALTMLAVLECLGAVEALQMAFPGFNFPGYNQAIGSAAMALLAFTVWGGIHVVTKLGVVFALVVFLTLFSYYFGLLTATECCGERPMVTGISYDTLKANWNPHYDDATSFGTVLGLFYPCFTGILSGANRADVLKDPPKNIRRGTFAAITFSFVLYSTLFVLWASVADHRFLQGQELSEDRRLGGGGEAGARVVDRIAWSPLPKWAFMGIIIASLSQALQCLIVAPRMMQSLAADKIFAVMNPLRRISMSGEPVRALAFTYVVAGLLVLIGKLDVVAPLLTMCFLVAYGFVNLSCFVLTWAKSPTWRPAGIFKKRWRVWYLGMGGAGFCTCLAIMVTVDHYWALAACLMAAGIYLYVEWRFEASDWGNAMDGIKHKIALKALIDLEARQELAVNWRPHILVLYRINLGEELQGVKHHEILRFCSQLRKSRGFCIVACVLEADEQDEVSMRTAAVEKSIIKSIMQDEGIEGFAEVVVAPTWLEGTNYIIQLSGMGGLVPNTIMLDWPEKWEENAQAAQDFVKVLDIAQNSEKAVMAVKGLQGMPFEAVQDGTIDIWWMIHDGGFLILVSWLLSQHRVWRHCHLRVFTLALNVTEDEASTAAKQLTAILRKKRLFDVQVEVIIADDDTVEPYTYDWTLRVKDRHAFLSDLNRGLDNVERLEPIPLEIADLFHMEASPEPGKRHGQQSSRSSASAATEERVAVSDCRRGKSQPTAQPGELPAGTDEQLTRTGEGVTRNVDDRPVRSSSGSPLVLSLAAKGKSGSSAATSTVARPQPAAGNDSGGAPKASSPAARSGATSTRRVSQWTDVESCQKLNEVVLARSKLASLIVMNLPTQWGTDCDEATRFMKYCDTLTTGLERVLFLHSTGHVIVDIAS